MFAELKRMNARQVALQVLNIMTILTSALMIWKALALALNNESPIVVVLSGSMEPAFHRGDLLVLSLPKNDPIEVNDICVFKLPERPVPIVHRVIKLHDDAETGKQYLLTKGDNNPGDDRSLYDYRQMWIHQEHIVGKVRGFVPYVGMVTIMMNDYPILKYVLLGVLGLFALVQRE
ncbi:signal peptidase complex catalytic subunit SEC11C-like protein [Absidia repens]|uniref:Signal peptidase complex catalytic subunit SEC11 n=1 Tax=Absidia repens TaxID=90262 RepID=A0A1X2I410_9FUNG|nr:signal peptidase complex catalytic subunit SEC11C-like protein [Absidia repens]